MKKKNKGIILISIVLIIVLTIALTVATFAYFSAVKEAGLDKLTLTVEENSTKNTATIYSVYDLKVWARDSKYNSAEPESATDSRTILSLGADITLDQDIFVDRDVNLVLNGHTLTLGAFNLVIQHSYRARMYIADTRYGTPSGGAVGQIVGTGKIIVSAPFAVTVLDSALSQLTKDRVQIVAFDAPKLVAEIKAKINKEIYAYITTDLYLFTNFSGYGYRIQWTASAITATGTQNTYITSDGRVNCPSTGAVKVNLHYSILNEDGIEAPQGAGDVEVTILSAQEVDTRLTIGETFITDYFVDYYNATALNYDLFLSIGLPSGLPYYGLEFVYTTAVAGAATITDLAGTAAAGDLTLLRPNGARAIDLKVSVQFSHSDAGNTPQISKREKVFNFVAVDGNNSNASQTVLDKIGVLIVEDANTVRPLLALADYEKYNIAAIEYSFENNNNNYAVRRVASQDELYVAAGGLPGYEEKIYLKLKITYKTGRPIESTMKSQIFYVDATLGGGGSPGADPYAYYHHLITQSMLDKTNNGQTYVSFAMPKKSLNSVQVRYYLSDTGVADPYGGRIVIEYPAGSDYANFIIDRTKLKTTNEQVKVYFKYGKSASDDILWDSVAFYGKKINEVDGTQTGVATSYNFMLSGLLKQGSDIADPELFNFLWSSFNVSDMDAEKIITADEVHFSSKTTLTIQNTKIANYKGIEYLKTITELHILNSGFLDSDFQYLIKLSKINNLTIEGSGILGAKLVDLRNLNNLSRLTLFNNNLSAGFDLSECTALAHLKLQNCAISSVKNLAKLTNLQTLYLNNVEGVTQNPNTIRRFDGLSRLTKLSELHLYGNTAVGGLAPEKFGSAGEYNSSAFTLYTEHGVAVYNTISAGVPMMFSTTPAQTESAHVVESVFYFGTATLVSGNVTLSFASSIQVSSAAGATTYPLSWGVVGRSDIAGTTVDNTITFTVPAVAEQRIELVVSCTVGGKTVYRVIEVQAVAA